MFIAFNRLLVGGPNVKMNEIIKQTTRVELNPHPNRRRVFE